MKGLSILKLGRSRWWADADRHRLAICQWDGLHHHGLGWHRREVKTERNGDEWMIRWYEW